MSRQTEEILILTKTYPSPSTKYREITCVGGMTRNGEMRRLFPVPYRFLSDDGRFKKWEWIRASVATTDSDHRPESRRIDVDSIELLGERIGTDNSWHDRREIITPQIIEDFFELEQRRKKTGQTLGVIRPKSICELIVTQSKESDWTEEDRAKLAQDGLFDTKEMRDRIILQKLPFDFYYKYISGENTYKHKIIDWEAGALYWNCVKRHGEKGWEVPFRHKLEAEFATKDLFLLMGTIHRFPDKWLIVGLIYPPKLPPAADSEQLGFALD